MASRVIVETALGASCGDIRPPPSDKSRPLTSIVAICCSFDAFNVVVFDVVETLLRCWVSFFCGGVVVWAVVFWLDASCANATLELTNRAAMAIGNNRCR
jgi:hypothetical protein